MFWTKLIEMEPYDLKIFRFVLLFIYTRVIIIESKCYIKEGEMS